MCVILCNLNNIPFLSFTEISLHNMKLSRCLVSLYVNSHLPTTGSGACLRSKVRGTGPKSFVGPDRTFLRNKQHRGVFIMDVSNFNANSRDYMYIISHLFYVIHVINDQYCNTF